MQGIGTTEATREVTGRWSSLVALGLCALYFYSFLWLVLWTAVPAALFGWEPVLITSNSMAPQIRAGDLVLVARAPPDLTVGSVIMFESGGHAITHRIVAINADNNYVTQGDGNPLPDSTPVAPEAVIGAPRLMVSTVGMPLLWLRHGDWVLVALWLFATVAAGSYLIGSARTKGNAPTDRPRPRLAARAGRAIRSGGGKTALVLTIAGSMVVGIPEATGAFSDVAANAANTYTASDWEAIVGLAGGGAHTCGVNEEGAVWCWGLNDKGQLGDGTTTKHDVPVRVVGSGGTGYLTDVVTIAAGLKHTCVIKTDATVWCWGSNNEGQLGDNTITTRPSPVQVLGPGGTGTLTNAATITAGELHTCVVKTDATAWCWGRNDKGQLGDNTTTDHEAPVQVLGPGGTGTLTNADQIAAGLKHACVVKTDATVWCWGSNNEGQLGDNTITTRPSPVQVLGPGGTGTLTNAATITAGELHTCVVKTDATAWCWGRNDKGQLGDNTTTDHEAPVQVLGPGGTGTLTNADQIAAGLKHACVVKTDATVWCWGLNDKGQLGDNTTTTRPSPVQVLGPGAVGTLTNVITEGAGDSHTCAARTNHTIYCWGHNNNGQLGDNTATNRPAPVPVLGFGRIDRVFVGLAGGGAHTCGVNEEGAVWCWGLNDKGQLGDGTTTKHDVPVRVVGSGGTGYLTDVVTIAAGLKHTCVIKTDATVWCWGSNNEGQLGDNTITTRPSPVQVLGPGGTGTLTNAATITAGELHTCVVKTDATAWCWGRNDKGQLGDNTTTDHEAPVQVLGPGGTGTLTNADQIAAGLKHACVVKTDATVWCWGLNDKGQLGDNTTTDRPSPVQVLGPGGTGTLTNAATITAGELHTCVVKTDATAWCWGRNDKGQLGDNTTTDHEAPVQVLGPGGTGTLTNADQIAAGLKHACVVKTDATVWCWGLNDKGQLGDNTTTTRPSPVQVLGPGAVGTLTNVITEGAGDSHTCAARTNHTIYCWGHNNNGQLGDNTATNRPAPVPVLGFG